MSGHRAILHAQSRELNRRAHSYWNSSTLSILLLWINAIYFCHWLIHRVFSCNLQKQLVNHLSRNYKIKCFFPLLTLVLGARLSGGGMRKGCVTVHKESCQQFLLSFSQIWAWRTLRCWGTLLLCFTCSCWREGLALTAQLCTGWVDQMLHPFYVTTSVLCLTPTDTALLADFGLPAAKFPRQAPAWYRGCGFSR